MRGFGARIPFLTQPIDVLEHDDGCIHDHADGEGDAGQADDIQCPSERGHGDEGADDGNGNGQRYDEGGAPGPQEQHENQGRENAADDNVLLHQRNCGIHIERLIEHILEQQADIVERAGGQVVSHPADLIHHGQNVRTLFAGHVERHRAVVPAIGKRPGFLVAEFDLGHITHLDPANASVSEIGVRAQHNVEHLVRVGEVALCPYGVAALALVHIPAGD